MSARPKLEYALELLDNGFAAGAKFEYQDVLVTSAATCRILLNRPYDLSDEALADLIEKVRVGIRQLKGKAHGELPRDLLIAIRQLAQEVLAERGTVSGMVH